MNIGIIGYGWVGKATKKLFPNAQIYDKFIPEYSEPLHDCELAFLAVPTPWNGNNGLDCSAVEDAIAECGCDFIVLRSATQPGFADAMAEKYQKRIVVQPEYLGETTAHPLLDMDSRNFIILGGDASDRRTVIDCYSTVYNANIRIRQVSRLEAEVIKFSENRAIFYKVMQCQELYDACTAAGIDYYTIRDAVYGDDPRMNLWWTFVYPDQRGANSKCIPKDVYAWCAWAESVGLDPEATRSLLKYNSKLLKNIND
jgi:UDP-glucose 6-dehydrogenase